MMIQQAMGRVTKRAGRAAKAQADVQTLSSLGTHPEGTSSAESSCGLGSSRTKTIPSCCLNHQACSVRDSQKDCVTCPPLSFSLSHAWPGSIHPHVCASLKPNILSPLSFITYSDIPSLQRPRLRALCSKMAAQNTLKPNLG